QAPVLGSVGRAEIVRFLREWEDYGGAIELWNQEQGKSARPRPLVESVEKTLLRQIAFFELDKEVEEVTDVALMAWLKSQVIVNLATEIPNVDLLLKEGVKMDAKAATVKQRVMGLNYISSIGKLRELPIKRNQSK
ncbi:unnamed protein product, partial [Chrysoparadoxa australica]